MSAASLFPALHTERLFLRELSPDDKQALYNIFKHEPVVRHYGVTPFEHIKRAEAMIRRWQNLYPARKGIRWGLTLKGDPTLIGTCGFKTWHKSSGVSEIAYDLAPEQWNKGLMTEAVAAVVAHGFAAMRLNRIEAWTTIENEASMRVLGKVGFTREGTQRERGFWNGKHHDLALFGLLKREWNEAQS